MRQGTAATLLSFLSWSVIWILMVLGIILGGAVTGGALFLLVGLLAELEYSPRELVYNGLHDGGFYAMIWAPGISFVACLMMAYRKRRKSADDQS